MRLRRVHLLTVMYTSSVRRLPGHVNDGKPREFKTGQLLQLIIDVFKTLTEIDEGLTIVDMRARDSGIRIDVELATVTTIAQTTAINEAIMRGGAQGDWSIIDGTDVYVQSKVDENGARGKRVVKQAEVEEFTA